MGINNRALQRRLQQGALGTITVQRGDDITPASYPQDFSYYVGQRKAVDHIMTAVQSARQRQVRMGHTLIGSAVPGIGKSSLARLTAKALGVGLVELGGSIKDKDAVKALRVMEDNDVLFIDEVHRLVRGGKAGIEWMLTLLEDGTIHLPTGLFQAPDITIIAATTDVQKLPQTILDRFPIQPVLQPYTDADAMEIARLTAKRAFGKANVTLPESTLWLGDLATAGQGNPRKMRIIIDNLLDHVLTTPADQTHTERGYCLDVVLDRMGLTEDGLDTLQQEYLLALFVLNGSAGITTLRAQLTTDHLGHTEAHLINRGYVVVTGRGRELTDFGTERAMALAAEYQTDTESKEDAA